MEASKSSMSEMEQCPSEEFDQRKLKYLCCCTTMHVQLGASLIAIFSLCGLSINLAYRVTQNQFTASGIIPLLVGSFAVFTLILGLRLKKEVLLIPYLIVQTLGILAVIVLLILCFSSLVASTFSSNEHTASKDAILSHRSFELKHTTNEEDEGLNTQLTIIMLLCELLLQIWFLRVVWQAYRYAVDLKIFQKMHGL